MTIEERAAKLLEEVLEKYYSRDEWNNKPLMQMIEDELAGYNDDIARELNKQLSSTLAGSFTKSIPVVIPKPVQLSKMLYKNGDKVAAETYQVLKAAQKAKITSKELAMQLYDGYNWKDERVIDVIEKFPNYVKQYVKKPATQKAFLKKINKLKTKPYQTAMKELNKAVVDQNEKAINRAMKTILEERSRYYANRIAVTENQRAKSLSNAKDMLEDEDIEFVRYEMSSTHKIFDICDYYANLDVGYGKGIVPKDEMVSIPLHPHCRCKYVPKYKEVKKHKVGNQMDKFTDEQQRDILGSWDNLADYKSGTPLVDVMNKTRPKYKIKPVKDLL